MGMRAYALADVARQVCNPYGVEVVETAGWQGRGYDLIAPDVALRHWTAGSPYGVFGSYGILVNGRAGLPGPLCNLAQSRESVGLDKIYVIAAGKANHAGDGNWNGVTGNYYTLGLEIEWSGPSEAFSPERQMVSELAMMTLMRFCGDNPDDCCEHREWTSRKIDTNLDGDLLRQVIRSGVPSWTPSTPPTPNPPPSSTRSHMATIATATHPTEARLDQVAIGTSREAYHRTGHPDPTNANFIGKKGWSNLRGLVKSVDIAWSVSSAGQFLEITAQGNDPENAPYMNVIKHPDGVWSGWIKTPGQLLA